MGGRGRVGTRGRRGASSGTRTVLPGVVHEVTATEVVLKDGNVLPYGLCIWSTGVGPTPFTVSLPFAKTTVGRIAVDKLMRVLAPPGPSPPGVEAKPGGGAAASEAGDAAGRARPAGPPAELPLILADESDTPSTARLAPVPHIYVSPWSAAAARALGDCCANPDAPLPALAQALAAAATAQPAWTLDGS
ncbi:Alternative NAD(P)H dehydrogenase 2, mitochondrial [Tetrabaena socialis]|uniref:Alternative NAD(P)H dehydrogenase 2, mitochondrial n=1 Tax=Tetrabaena socialis TaxID=47790 RepID=A0A2J7ZKD1_9CHLO|nr:Alternative NAD(P)H dehydrogenase 2, mitochondrial [Tetrabaena socialis]|eukprot:PNH00726.1 Alternative NAD(P)H dehydrogenase 2, mitochondrial [Tetrabaena socialis]